MPNEPNPIDSPETKRIDIKPATEDGGPIAELAAEGAEDVIRPQTSPSTAPAKESTAELREQLAYFRDRAIKLDDEVFQMRALLQSGKGFSEILHLESLLNTIMAVIRERYRSLR